MAAIDVLSSSPLTPGQNAPWSSFEDYIDFPSPVATPRLPFPTQAQAQVHISQTQPVTGRAIHGELQDSTTGSPPPPGSSPETLFRYYLAAELRRIGSSADDSIIDKYVAQHYDSFAKAMDRQQQSQGSSDTQTDVRQAPSTSTPAQSSSITTSNLLPSSSQNASTPSPFAMSAARYPGDVTATNLSPVMAKEPDSIDPHLVELSSVHQPFTVSRLPPFQNKSDLHAPSHSSNNESSFRGSSVEVDEMSEDNEDEDNKEVLHKSLAVPVKSEYFDETKEDRSAYTAFRPSRIGATEPNKVLHHEEAPIPGSIMGPSNELRPDPDEYRKLSSKEKRQLRNKISARNFRTRRKEHIAHLEQRVADRDTVIEGLRQQLCQVTLQNKELSDEIQGLKSKSIGNSDVARIVEALQKGFINAPNGASSSTSTPTDMAPPASLPRSLSSASLSDANMGGMTTRAANGSSRPSTPNLTPSSPRPTSPRPAIVRRQSPAISQPNTKKDLPPSAGSSSTSRSFWGGVGGAGGNFMSVHTVLMPQLASLRLMSPEKSKRDKNSLASVSHISRITSQSPEYSTVDKRTHKRTHDGVTEILEGHSTKQKDTKQQAMTDAEVNQAFTSLLGQRIETDAPPSYSEAIGEVESVGSRRQSGRCDEVHEAVLTALNSAFCRLSNVEVTRRASCVDQAKVFALLRGEASLCLVDNATGLPWTSCAEQK